MMQWGSRAQTVFKFQYLTMIKALIQNWLMPA